MSIALEVEIFGDVQFSREIMRVGDRGGDLSPAFESIFGRLREINAEQFMSEGSRGSGGWAPLKPDTVLQKAREGYRTEILRRTDALFEAMASHSDPNQEVIITQDWAVFRVTGEPGEYGPLHQTGTDNMPARPPFALTEADGRAFVKELQSYVITGNVGHFQDWL